VVIDTSAIIALMLNEPQSASLETSIREDPTRIMSAASALEAAIVCQQRFGEQGGAVLDRWIEKAGVVLVPFDGDQLGAAREAYRRFGRGRHPAGLNYGDCFAYALSSVSGQPLLFVGNDFNQTDVDAVSY